MQVQGVALKQEQRQKLSQQLIQSINLLPLTITELNQKINEELENNPALEVKEKQEDLSYDALNTIKPEENTYFEESSDSGFIHRTYSDDEDSQRSFLEGVLSKGENLHDHLLWQLKLQRLSEHDYATGELLINNLNADGFHIEPPETLLKPSGSLDHLNEMLKLIQGLDPVGCGVKDWKESLLVQMRLLDFPQEAETLVLTEWELLEKKKYKEIAQHLKVDEQEVQNLIQDIKILTPFPGRAFNQDSSAFVVPDISIYYRDGDIILRINEEDIPVLRINKAFRDDSESYNDTNKQAKAFTRQKAMEAERFIQNLKFRKNTLFKVSRAISEFQSDFFQNGPKYLKPLTLKDIAQELEINESTVSRITTGKYVQTEWGIYELKYFFSNAVSGSQPYSKEGVKQIIKEILSDHKDSKKLSDQKISELLDQRGIQVARRTVTKYRLELAAEE